ncbi:MAG: D-alanine--D-alanine ligase [Fimbriimonadaceae bacterium]|nr:D-alanine--D-alanine ligase [Fimbriimonadaceae bacterium]
MSTDGTAPETIRTRAPVVLVSTANEPETIRGAIVAARRGGRLVAVYQPYRHRTLQGRAEAFAEALSEADAVVLADIDPGDEPPVPGVSAAQIADHLRVPTRHVPAWRYLTHPRLTGLEATDTILLLGSPNLAGLGPGIAAAFDPRERTRVAVVYGGTSAEREVSVHSGREVHRALVARGYDAFLVDLADLLLGEASVAPFVGPNRPDVVFLAVHGTHGEDGATQGFFELLGLPYTGSNVLASAVGMDKNLTKAVLERAGLPVPRGELLTKPNRATSLPPPVVVKPNAQGSTVGLSFVESTDQLERAIEHGYRYDDALLVEEWLRGMEISVPVLGDRALPPVEIAPKSGRYDFASKYVPGATEEIVPARLLAPTLALVQEFAVRAHGALGCRGATRTDMIVAEDRITILEVNTLPGMTSTSLLPNSARAVGVSFEDLVEWIVQDALRHAQA